MQTQIIYIDQDTGTVSAQCTAQVDPALFAVLGTTLALSIAFTSSGTPGAITSYTASSLRLSMKPLDQPDATVGLLPDGTWGSTGSGATTRYTWTALANSAQLQALIGSEVSARYQAQIEWSITTDSNRRKSLPFEILIINSPARTDDAAPDLSSPDAWEWLKARLVSGSRVIVTKNDGSLTATFDYTPATSPGWAAWTGTDDKATYATYTCPAFTDPPTVGEVTALGQAVQHLSRAHKALLVDLFQSKFPTP